MKLRNIKKYYKDKIREGWRWYLDLDIPYVLIGVDNNFMQIKDIERLLDLKWSGRESGFVDYYDMLDMNKKYKDQPLNVNLNIDYSYHLDVLREEFPNILTLQDGDKYYYIEGVAGYKNPKCIWNEEEGEYTKGEDYWLYKDDDKLKMHRWYYSIDEDSSKVQELLQRFINNKKLGSDLFSGDFIYSMLSGNWGQNINNELLKDLSKLAEYCKTTYEEFYDDFVRVTYAIRYKENVEPFLSDLKQIIKNYKIKLR